MSPLTTLTRNLILIGACALSACGDDDTNSSTGAAQGSAGTAAPDSSAGSTATTGSRASGVISAQAGAGTAADRAAASPQLNDAQIAGVSLAANNGEVEQNMIATTKATTPDLRAFASDMVAMHTAASARETALAATLMVTPQDSPVTQMLQSMSQETVAMLNGLDGSEFDAVYVKSQVDAHEQVLMLVVGTLLPQAQAPELRDELTAMRETVMGHLDRARSLGESTSVNP